MAEEGELQKAVVAYLTARGLQPYRINCGKIRRKYQMAPTGWPDLCVILPPSGRLVGFELKAAKGVAREAQEAMQTAWEASGAIYKFVRSIEEVKETLAHAQGR